MSEVTADELVTSLHHASKNAREILSKLIEFSQENKDVMFVLAGNAGSYSVESIPKQIARFDAEFKSLIDGEMSAVAGVVSAQTVTRDVNKLITQVVTTFTSGYSVTLDIVRTGDYVTSFTSTVKDDLGATVETITRNVLRDAQMNYLGVST